MKLEFLSKSLDYLAGEPSKTRVVLGNAEGATYPVFFEPTAIELGNAELEAMALEAIYQKNFPGRAEAEKFLAHEQALADVRVAAQEAREATVANREAVNQAIVEMTDLVASIYARLAEAGIITEEEEENDQST